MVLELSVKETKLNVAEQLRIAAEEIEAQTKLVIEKSKLQDMTKKLKFDLKLDNNK